MVTSSPAFEMRPEVVAVAQEIVVADESVQRIADDVDVQWTCRYAEAVNSIIIITVIIIIINYCSCTPYIAGVVDPTGPNMLGILVWSGAEGREELRGFCVALVKLAMPNCAPAVELIIGQPHRGQPSMTMPPFMKQRGRLI